MRRCRQCHRLLKPGRYFFCDNGICTKRFFHSPRNCELMHTEVNKLMKAIIDFKEDKKFIFDRCRHCGVECKIHLTAGAKDFIVYCDNNGLRCKALELGIARLEIPLGHGPVEVEI